MATPIIQADDEQSFVWLVSPVTSSSFVWVKYLFFFGVG